MAEKRAQEAERVKYREQRRRQRAQEAEDDEDEEQEDNEEADIGDFANDTQVRAAFVCYLRGFANFYNNSSPRAQLLPNLHLCSFHVAKIRCLQLHRTL